jgi:hypothetical protein
MNVMNGLYCANLMWLTLGSQHLVAQQQMPIELPCYAIQGKADALCTLVTSSPFGPFDDVVFYRKDVAGNLTFLRTVSGTVATFSFQGSSENGDFVALAWAEEGHPIFSIYHTSELLSDISDPQPLTVISQYPFSHIDIISDDGVVVYGSEEEISVERCALNLEQFRLTDNQYCHKVRHLSPK